MSEAETFKSQGIKDLLGHILPTEENRGPDYLTQDITRACTKAINESACEVLILTRDKSKAISGEKADRVAHNQKLETAITNFEGATIAQLENFPLTTEVRKKIAHSLVVNHPWWYLHPDASQTS